ncbi:MAG: hypothetical protein V7636_71 [Actinomycetota bacterium]
MSNRMRYALVAAAAAVFMAGIAFAVTRDDAPPTHVAVGDRGTTSTSSSSTTKTVDDATTTSTRAVPTTTTTSTTAAPTTTTTEKELGRPCAQVDTFTANGLAAQVCQEGASVAGTPTTLHITASDGDAEVDDDCRSPDVEWGDEPSVRCMIACQMSDKPSGPSSIDITRDHTYEQPGTYHVSVTVDSNCGSQPYGESHTLELDLVMR